MSKMRLGMHEEKWDIWNGTQGMESSTSHDTAHRAWSQAQGMTQHIGMESSTRHDTAQHTGHGVKHKA